MGDGINHTALVGGTRFYHYPVRAKNNHLTGGFIAGRFGRRISRSFGTQNTLNIGDVQAAKFLHMIKQVAKPVLENIKLMVVAQYFYITSPGHYFQLWILFFDDLEMLVI